MPAYFDISLQFRREDLYPDFIADFDAHLERSGLKFLSGCWEDEGLSRREIAAWNQKKLEADFVLGMKTHRSHDYKQTLYGFGGYEEVRGFWMNHHPEHGVFTYFIIIPEYDVLTQEGSNCFPPEQTEKLRALAEAVWQFPLVRAIQTGLEFSDGPAGLSALEAGEAPYTEPFAILERDCPRHRDGTRMIELTKGRPGVLLLAEDYLAEPIE